MEQDKIVYTVDFKDVHYYLDIHKVLKEGLELPDYYGANLDALWDCMKEIIDNDIEIVLKNYQDVEGVNREYAQKILDVFKEAKHYSNDAYVGSRIIVERDGVETEID